MTEFELRLRYGTLDGWSPVASAHDTPDHDDPTQHECVLSHVLEAIPGVLPDADGDEAATLVELRELPALSLEDVDEMLEIIGDYSDLIEWLAGPLAYAVEYECLPRLRELRAALAAETPGERHRVEDDGPSTGVLCGAHIGEVDDPCELPIDHDGPCAQVPRGLTVRADAERAGGLLAWLNARGCTERTLEEVAFLVGRDGDPLPEEIGEGEAS